MQSNDKSYILFWLSGSVSQLGSAMTGFALILWSYGLTGSALSVSLLAFFSYLPYVLASLTAGGFVDRHSKKAIMLAADTAAALCSLLVLLAWSGGRLAMWHIYLANGAIGVLNAFQAPAQSVAVGRLVPRERLAQASGMDCFSSSLISAAAPALAAALYALGGLGAVILADLCSFLAAFFVLLRFIRIPEGPPQADRPAGALAGCRAGFRFLRAHRGLWYIVLTMAALNFLSNLTYETVLAPMLLARSGSFALGVVSAVVGAGGILGGVLVSTGRWGGDSVRMIYGCAAISFLCGDLLMAVSRGLPGWCAAALAASVPVPFVLAGQRVLLYRAVPLEVQGRVFAVRNAVQFSTIPAGILLGGILADYLFEPLMRSGGDLARGLGLLVGTGPGSGMAAMFLCTGLLGFLASLLAYHTREIRALRRLDRDAPGGG